MFFSKVRINMITEKCAIIVTNKAITIWTNKRSKDLGALLDSCRWDDIGNFLQTCIKNSLLH